MARDSYCFICQAPLTTFGYTVKKLPELRKEFKKLYGEDIDVEDLESPQWFVEDKDNQKLYPDFVKKVKKNLVNIENVKAYQWLEKGIFFHRDGRVISVTTYDSWQGTYEDDLGNEYTDLGCDFTLPSLRQLKSSHNSYCDGLAVHKSCYEVLKKNMGLSALLICVVKKSLH